MRLAEHAEDLTGATLALQGWNILGRNVRGPGTEIDLIVEKDGILVIVEVKGRWQWPCTADEFAGLLPAAKRAALRRGADRWLARTRFPLPRTVRFDLVVVRFGRPTALRFYRNALYE